MLLCQQICQNLAAPAELQELFVDINVIARQRLNFFCSCAEKIFNNFFLSRAQKNLNVFWAMTFDVHKLGLRPPCSDKFTFP